MLSASPDGTKRIVGAFRTNYASQRRRTSREQEWVKLVCRVCHSPRYRWVRTRQSIMASRRNMLVHLAITAPALAATKASYRHINQEFFRGLAKRNAMTRHRGCVINIAKQDFRLFLLDGSGVRDRFRLSCWDRVDFSLR